MAHCYTLYGGHDIATPYVTSHHKLASCLDSRLDPLDTFSFQSIRYRLHSSMSDMPISDPSPSYSFPPRHSSSASSSQSSSLPQRRVSRPSPSASVDPASSSRPQHEIQPPSRRLSSHQMLLLTPFGSNVPDGIFVPGESSSFMTRNVPISAEMSVGSSSNMTRMRTKSVGRSQDPRTSTFPPPSGMRRGSSRMGSPSSSNMQVANPSSLVSAPMSTIPSASESETEIEAAHGHHVESGASVYPVFIGDHLSTVPMTRSTSSPVMSLQALEELKRKDGELGIARGGMWAWISHDMDEVDSPRGESSTMIQSSNPRDVTPSPTTSASLPLFRDPFAPPLPLGASVMTREIPTSASSSTTTFSQLDGKGRVATASNYHYSPNQAVRRSSQPPSRISKTSRSHKWRSWWYWWWWCWCLGIGRYHRFVDCSVITTCQPTSKYHTGLLNTRCWLCIRSHDFRWSFASK
ncbi:hypothetical protein BD324DRAFT_434088 [Kockovaella imperatae]|uniref:Uncharacterized protein n=1 Tax=Kockovaella imperatae TaxID=4999 RepID=A0A1Y1UIB2_9TREE|nr:hypothetical protein BD324DRAFT_434088 [Kockovaella imperatae]ORX37226.1 hypothetical protein BD324DRAFT_434088 [Kockovaella imperatae]